MLSLVKERLGGIFYQFGTPVTLFAKKRDGFFTDRSIFKQVLINLSICEPSFHQNRYDRLNLQDDFPHQPTVLKHQSVLGK